MKIKISMTCVYKEYESNWTAVRTYSQRIVFIDYFSFVVGEGVVPIVLVHYGLLYSLKLLSILDGAGTIGFS